MSRTSRELATDSQISFLSSLRVLAQKKEHLPIPLYKDVATDLISQLVDQGYGEKEYSFGNFTDGYNENCWSSYMWGAY